MRLVAEGIEIEAAQAVTQLAAQRREARFVAGWAPASDA